MSNQANLKLLEQKIDAIYHELSTLSNSAPDKKRKAQLKKQLAYILHKLSQRKFNTKKAEAQKYKTITARETKELLKETRYDEMIRRMKADLQKNARDALQHAQQNPRDEVAQQQLILANDAMNALDQGVAQGQPIANIQQAVEAQKFRFIPKANRWMQFGKRGFIAKENVPQHILEAQAPALAPAPLPAPEEIPVPTRRKKHRKVRKPHSDDSDGEERKEEYFPVGHATDFLFTPNVSDDSDIFPAKLRKNRRPLWKLENMPVKKNMVGDTVYDLSDEEFKSQDDDEQSSHAFGKYTRGSGFISDALKKVGSVLGSIGKPIFESMPALKPFEGLLGENSLYSQVGNLAESAGLGSYPTQKRGLVNDYDRQERILKTIYKESKQRAIQALINEELLNQQLSKQEISDKQAGYYQLAYAKLMKELRDLNDEYRQNA